MSSKKAASQGGTSAGHSAPVTLVKSHTSVVAVERSRSRNMVCASSRKRHSIAQIVMNSSNSSGHGRRYAQAAMDAHKVIMREVESDRRSQILDLLRESVGESRESAHVHLHREVLTLHVVRF
jgi:hypothetical protein